MRQRGEHLLVAEFDKCEPVGFISPTTGGNTATVDDIVMQLKPAIAPSVGHAARLSAPPRPRPPHPRGRRLKRLLTLSSLGRRDLVVPVESRYASARSARRSR